ERIVTKSEVKPEIWRIVRTRLHLLNAIFAAKYLRFGQREEISFPNMPRHVWAIFVIVLHLPAQSIRKPRVVIPVNGLHKNALRIIRNETHMRCRLRRLRVVGEPYFTSEPHDSRDQLSVCVF